MPLRFTVCAPAFSGSDKFDRLLSVGASLTEFTVIVNVWVVRLFCACPSFTVTVIVAVPLALATGVKVKLPVPFGLA